MGYTALKFDPFGQNNYYKISLEELDIAEKRVESVRKSVGDNIDTLIEAHAKFNVMNAIKIGKKLEKYNPLWYEEPVSEERISELLEVRRKVNIPIATGERLYTKFPFSEIVDKTCCRCSSTRHCKCWRNNRTKENFGNCRSKTHNYGST